MNEEPVFDHEKLDVYQIELLFVAWVAALLTEVRRSARLVRVCIARFAISLIAPVSHPCSTPLKVRANARGSSVPKKRSVHDTTVLGKGLFT